MATMKTKHSIEQRATLADRMFYFAIGMTGTYCVFAIWCMYSSMELAR
jgi:hypothetical protein